MTVQPVSNADEARARAERIREGIRAMASWADDVRTAWLQRDDRVLGYPSWTDYLHGEFDSLPRLSKAVRDAAMALLAEAGMPQREIAATTGVNQSTVARRRDANASRKGGAVAKRTGGTAWSRRVQNVSKNCPMAELSDDEVAELLGAAQYLRDYCRGELTTREARK